MAFFRIGATREIGEGFYFKPFFGMEKELTFIFTCSGHRENDFIKCTLGIFISKERDVFVHAYLQASNADVGCDGCKALSAAFFTDSG